MALFHLVYCSASTEAEFSPPKLMTLLAECRRKNAAVGVTGMLLYQSGSFFQVLEGDEDTLLELYEHISADRRHGKARKLIFEAIDQRDFSDWTMAYPAATRRQLAEIPGLNDFFTAGSSFMTLEEGRAKTLLAAFKDGKWRAAF